MWLSKDSLICSSQAHQEVPKGFSIKKLLPGNEKATRCCSVYLRAPQVADGSEIVKSGKFGSDKIKCVFDLLL